MKTLARITLLALLMLAFALPVAAQEATATPIVVINDVPVSVPGDTPTLDIDVVVPPTDGLPESTQVAIIVGITGVLSVGIVAFAITQNKSPKELYWGLPAPVTQWGVPFAWDMAYRRALLTADTADDNALIELAKSLGYSVETLPDGTVRLSKAPPIT